MMNNRPLTLRDIKPEARIVSLKGETDTDPDGNERITAPGSIGILGSERDWPKSLSFSNGASVFVSRDELLDPAQYAAPPRVWVLTWGGGDEPETPGITVHRTREGALAEARRNMEVWASMDDDDVAESMRELDETGTACELPNETWMSLDATDLGE